MSRPHCRPVFMGGFVLSKNLKMIPTIRTSLSKLVQLTFILATGWAHLATAAAQAPAEPVFIVKHFEASGNSVLPAAEVDELLSAYIGNSRTLGDIETARQALQALYAKHGYTTVMVALPEQDVTEGRVRLQVRELKVGQVKVMGAQHHDDANIREAFPALQEGGIPNTVKLAESLRLANDNPSKQTQFLFKPTKDMGTVDALLRVVDEKPWKAFATLDNTGNSQTGESRLGIGYQHANLFNRDHVATLQYITSPEQLGNVAIFGAGYRIPLYTLADTIDLYAGYSDVDSGTISGLFNVSGKGATLGGRYTHTFTKQSAFDHKVSLGLDYRAYQNDVIDDLGTSYVPDVTVHPVSLSYHSQWTGTSSQAGFYLTGVHNLPGGDKGGNNDFEPGKFGGRGGADASYQLWRLGGNVSHSFDNDWQLHAGLDVQHTDEPLVSGEQFGIGGQNSVRGFGERTISGDHGSRVSLEVFTPDLGDKTGLASARLRLLAFVEGANVRHLNPQPSEMVTESISSAGVGLRFGLDKNLSVRMDYGHVLNGGGDKQKDDDRLHASVAYTF